MKRPRDANELAKRIVDLAVGEATDREPKPKGKQLGGLARAASLTPEQRREMGRKGAAKRWKTSHTAGVAD